MSSDCEHQIEAGAYVLGAMTDGEAVAYAEHMQGCTRCAHEVRSLQVAVDILPMAAQQFGPPPELKDRIMGVVESEASLLRAAGPEADRAPEKKPRRRDRFAWLGNVRPGFAALGAAVLVAIGAGGGIIAASDSGDGPTHTIQASSKANVTLKAGRAAMHVHNLESLSGGRVYQVWLKHGSRAPVPTHTLFNVRPDGRATVDVDESVKGYDKLLVTEEPSGGSQAPTSPPVFTANI